MKNTSKLRQKIKSHLLTLADEKYREFSSSLIPNAPKMLGVRLPLLRQIAKEIAKENFREYLNVTPEFMEETILQGMAIGFYKAGIEEILPFIKNFIPKINNWSICDSFCAGLKIAKKNKGIVWNFIKKYARSNNEFEARFFYVMALDYFILPQYLNEIFEILNSAAPKGYYAKMGAAWLISICYVKYFNETEKFLLKNNLDKETLNKAVRKICDSSRVALKSKSKLKKMI